MFHMTNDSHLFRTAAQLEDDGFYPGPGQPLEARPEELYLPLYQGPHDFNTSTIARAPSASIRRSTHNPYALSEQTNSTPNST